MLVTGFVQLGSIHQLFNISRVLQSVSRKINNGSCWSFQDSVTTYDTAAWYDTTTVDLPDWARPDPKLLDDSERLFLCSLFQTSYVKTRVCAIGMKTPNITPADPQRFAIPRNLIRSYRPRKIRADRIAWKEMFSCLPFNAAG